MFESLELKEMPYKYDLFSLAGTLNGTNPSVLSLKGVLNPDGQPWSVTVPPDYIMYIKDGVITNTYSSAATIQISETNGSVVIPLITVEVGAGQTVLLSEDQICVSIPSGYYLEVVANVASVTGVVRLNAYFRRGGSLPF